MTVWVRQFSRDRGSIDEAQAQAQAETADNQAEARQSENHY